MRLFPRQAPTLVVPSSVGDGEGETRHEEEEGHQQAPHEIHLDRITGQMKREVEDCDV